jgi:ubiquitin-activating enzyme E1
MTHNVLSHVSFEALDRFRVSKKGLKPASWNQSDCEEFIAIAKEIVKERKYDLETEKWTSDSSELEFLKKFALTSRGVFGPLCAFFGGFTAQEVIKAITGKFSPTNQLFYYDAIELLPSIKPNESETFE